MRIDAMNKVSQLYQMNSTKNVVKKEKATQKDRVEISRIGMEFQIAKQAVQTAPDVDEERVQAIKEQMKNGTYQVSMEDLAEKLLAKFF